MTTIVEHREAQSTEYRFLHKSLIKLELTSTRETKISDLKKAISIVAILFLIIKFGLTKLIFMLISSSWARKALETP